MDTYTAELLVRGYEDAEREKVFEAARHLGCSVIIAKQNEIQLDIDKKWHDKKVRYKTLNYTEAADVIGESFHSFCQEVSIMNITSWRSRGGNTHIVLTLASEEFSVLDKIIFQCVLGSDPRRELLNWKRVMNGDPNPIALFKP